MSRSLERAPEKGVSRAYCPATSRSQQQRPQRGECEYCDVTAAERGILFLSELITHLCNHTFFTPKKPGREELSFEPYQGYRAWWLWLNGTRHGMGARMKRKTFRYEEAVTKVGRQVRAAVPIGRVPAGASGVVVRAVHTSDGSFVVIRWNRPLSSSRGPAGSREVWLSKYQYAAWLDEEDH